MNRPAGLRPAAARPYVIRVPAAGASAARRRRPSGQRSKFSKTSAARGGGLAVGGLFARPSNEAIIEMSPVEARRHFVYAQGTRYTNGRIQTEHDRRRHIGVYSFHTVRV
ncbi:hypothetical protein EVAR_61432_1 [Eumeta japonica]|uniref:Uncharacterized protein n=1 Tax=Eumeta variegata TaxID=151549 RepID=A0A4C1Y7I8_EUMVA|nr:hypothetical protein EVAR_61432_1 [Eumeta japonica]